MEVSLCKMKPGKKSASGLIKEYHLISMDKYGSGPGTGIRDGTYSGRHRRTGREKTPPDMNACFL